MTEQFDQMWFLTAEEKPESAAPEFVGVAGPFDAPATRTHRRSLQAFLDDFAPAPPTSGFDSDSLAADLYDIGLSLFPAPSRRALESMASVKPDRLVTWIQSGQLGPAHLAHAAQQLGEADCDPHLRLSVLVRLLAEPTPLVREGAVYGIAALLETSLRALAHATLTLVRDTDASPGVREAAGESLED